MLTSLCRSLTGRQFHSRTRPLWNSCHPAVSVSKELHKCGCYTDHVMCIINAYCAVGVTVYIVVWYMMLCCRCGLVGQSSMSFALCSSSLCLSIHLRLRLVQTVVHSTHSCVVSVCIDTVDLLTQHGIQSALHRFDLNCSNCVETGLMNRSLCSYITFHQKNKFNYIFSQFYAPLCDSKLSCSNMITKNSNGSWSVEHRL